MAFLGWTRHPLRLTAVTPSSIAFLGIGREAVFKGNRWMVDHAIVLSLLGGNDEYAEQLCFSRCVKQYFLLGSR